MTKKSRGASREGIRALIGTTKSEPKKPEERGELEERAVDEALRSPRVTVHSPLTSAVMKYLKLRNPGFNISAELREILEDAIRRKYPDEANKLSEALIRRKEEELRRRYGFR